MKKLSAIIFMSLVMAFALTGCGQPKTEELIAEAFSADAFTGTSPQEIINGLSSTSVNSIINTETMISFSYTQGNAIFEGDTGVSINAAIKSTPSENGINTYINSNVSVRLPEIVSMFTGFIEKKAPIQTYIRTDASTAKVFFNQGLFDGRQNTWTVSENSLTDLYSVVSQNIDSSQQATKEEDIAFLQKVLLAHSTREKKPIMFGEREVYAFNMDLSLGDPEVMEWIVKKATAVKPNGEAIADAEKIRTVVGQVCQLINIKYTYYIGAEEHKLVYSKLDYSDIDMDGLLRVIGANMPEGTASMLDGLTLQIKSGYFEVTNNPYEIVIIPAEVASTTYTYDTYNETFGKGEIVSLIDPDPEPEPDPIPVRVYKWKDDWSDTEFPALGTLGEYGHTDYMDMNLNTFLDDGWEIAGNEEEYEFMPMFNEFYPDTYLYLYDENYCGKTEGLEKKVVGYDIDISYAEPDSNIPQFSWKGLSWGATPAKVEKAYGEDNIREESEEYVFLTYSFDVADIEFSFYTGNDNNLRKGLYEVIVKYNHIPEPEYRYVYPEDPEYEELYLKQLEMQELMGDDASDQEDNTEEIEDTEAQGITHAIFTINDASKDVTIAMASTADGQAEEDVLHASTVNGEKPVDFEVSGNVVSRIQVSSDFGDSYCTTYDIFGEMLESKFFTIKTDEEADGNMAEFLINYYDGLLSAKTDRAATIKIKHEELIEISGQEGEFELMVYPFKDENIEKMGYEKLYLSGNATAPTNITVEIQGNTIHVVSDQEIDLLIEVEKDGEISEKQTGMVKEYDMTF